ncbi:MAG: hypothetical protein JWM04_2449 [Verrucomicrobiales bacterium]|nr:hypothetical protein [Verrucomicrobiales bacterium]
MKLLKWLPWRFFATRIARAHGFLDPIVFLARLRGFAQPSEVSEPVELLRAGVLFHARGLINTKAIQNNMDWVWPFWVEKQFNPGDKSFIPRAFSFSHINLTHRNWTAVGLPDIPYYPIVDPRGLVTPLYDGWSLDFWIVQENGDIILPSRMEKVNQVYLVGENIQIKTTWSAGEKQVVSEVSMELVGSRPHCVIRITPPGLSGARLAVVIRPYNPEGISFVDKIELKDGGQRMVVNGKDKLTFSETPKGFVFSNYKEGDVYYRLKSGTASSETEIKCDVSMATAAALFSLEASRSVIEIHIPILDEIETAKKPQFENIPSWKSELDTLSKLCIPDPLISRLFEQAKASLILHCPAEIYPGPYTYKRFWYRDAAFILNALITLGGKERSKKALALFPKGQKRNGYFLSQEGEWDSNGEVLWILHRYLRLMGEDCPESWIPNVIKAADWILNKRLAKNIPESHAGLLPAGFSAEHLGPNDYYYWDNFWGVSGLQCAGDLLAKADAQASARFKAAAIEYMETIQASFKCIPDRQTKGAISASPHRRMDSGAVGSMVADFPLQLFPPGEVRVLKTVHWLLENSTYGGGFFQNMIHSGINAYLTIHLAQVLLRAGDQRALDLIDSVAALASPTGQWPEAIHPQTFGGCMGDGQHIWAAAEWLMMIRNCFVREEGNSLIIGSGIFPRWLAAGVTLEFGPTLTPQGEITVSVNPTSNGNFALKLIAVTKGVSPDIQVSVPGYSASRNKHDLFLWDLVKKT